MQFSQIPLDNTSGKLQKNHNRNSWKAKHAIMGILNMTDDSFYDGGRFTTVESAMKRVEIMIEQGADIIDIGGQSSRPGAVSVGEQEEIARVEPVLRCIREKFPHIPISIDTYRSGVVDMAKQYNIDIINDISALNIDKRMIDAVVSSECAYVLMHMQGHPGTMQKDPQYTDVVSEVYSFFQEHIALLQARGIEDIILDPGFGFGKTVEQNYTLLANLSRFQDLGYPVLAGISRKSMLYRPIGITPEEALPASCGAHMIALMNGAQILRVHDVQEAKHIIQIFELYETNKDTSRRI